LISHWENSCNIWLKYFKFLDDTLASDVEVTINLMSVQSHFWYGLLMLARLLVSQAMDWT